MKSKIKLWHKVLIGTLLGITYGGYFDDISFLGITVGPKHLEIIGTVFLNMVKMVVVPLIFLSILNGITNVSDVSTFGRLGSKALFIYIFTTIFAVTIGIFFANVFVPGEHLSIEIPRYDYSIYRDKSLKDLFLNIIPSNPIKAMAEGNTLQIVVFSFFTGFALILIGDQGKEVKNLVSSATHLVFKMIDLVVQLTPYGVFAIMSWVVSKYGLEVMIHLGRFIWVVIGALTVQYILFGMMLLAIAKINPLPFYKKMLNTQALALATSSSKATLATAIREMTYRMGISKKSASFILPLGAAVNMDATAIYLGICSVFFAQIFNITLGLNEYIILVLTSTIGSIGAAGFPGGSMVMMSVVLSSVGIPLEGIAVILGVDRMLEMIRTMINITGDCTVTLIVDKMEGTFDEDIYYTKK